MSRSLAEDLRNIPGKATIFAHADLPELLTTDHEICPHPHISDLGKWDEDLIRLEAYLPHKPRGVRPHSCVFSHTVAVGLKKRGYAYVSQAQNLYSTDIAPFRHPWGIWELPIYYMDSMDFWMCNNWPEQNHRPFQQEIIEKAVCGSGLFVFDFHPLHLALNTRSTEDYVAVKERVVTQGQSPFVYTFPGLGVRDFFIQLCSRMHEQGIRSHTCSEVLKAYGCI